MTNEFLNTKLKPYNALTREEKHILLDAALDGNCECFVGLIEDWCDVEGCVGSFGSYTIYRTKPKEYKKLDIPWQVIDEKWKYAAMDENEMVYFFEDCPVYECTPYDEGVWVRGASEYGDYCTTIVIKLDTTGIVAEHSLTSRPEGL